MLLRRLIPPNFPIAWWMPYTWLVYIGLFVAYAIGRGDSAAWWTLHGLGLALFLVLYFRGFWLHGRPLSAVVLAITSLGLAFVPWNPGASVFFVYAGSFVAYIGPPRVALRWLAVVLALAAAEAFLLRLPIGTWLPSLVLPVLIGGGNIAFSQKQRADERLRLAQEEVEHLATVAERERIARDLHDLLGHTLSLIVLKSELASKLAERDMTRAATEIRDVERISRQALVEVRRAVDGYRRLTLAESLAGTRQALKAACVEVQEEVEPVRLEPLVEGVASMVLREAVTNIVRHARASRCTVRLRQEEGRVLLVVADDGVGGTGREGTGLESMRTRVLQAGGRFVHDGRAGTRIEVELPAVSARAEVPGPEQVAR